MDINDINLDDWKFATKIYKNKDDDVKEQFLKLKNQFKIKYKDREIQIKNINDITFLINAKDIMIRYTIINNIIYQFYY